MLISLPLTGSVFNSEQPGNSLHITEVSLTSTTYGNLHCLQILFSSNNSQFKF